MSKEKKTLYVLYKYEYDNHLNEIFYKRRFAHELLNHFLVIRATDEWITFYAYLCEYIGILFHFEETLERIMLSAEWNEEKEYWLMDEKIASTLMIFVATEMSCRSDLLSYNVSFYKH